MPTAFVVAELPHKLSAASMSSACAPATKPNAAAKNHKSVECSVQISYIFDDFFVTIIVFVCVELLASYTSMDISANICGQCVCLQRHHQQCSFIV